MAIQQIVGRGFYAPSLPAQSVHPVSFAGSSAIDATGEKFAYMGRVWNKDHATKAIRKVGFRFGAITKSGGSALTVSLQDVSLTAFGPDETQDQTVAIANADAAFSSNAWITTGNLSADRTVAYGELLSVVIEFDGAGRLGSDSVVISVIAGPSTNLNPIIPCALKTGGTWAAVAGLFNVILEFSDGTFGTLDGGFPVSGSNTHTYKQDTGTADEYACVFNFPFPVDVDGFWGQLAVTANTSDFDVVLYQGTTVLATVSVDVSSCISISTRLLTLPFPVQSLSANTDYYLSFKPTQTTNFISVFSFDVAVAGHMTVHELGAACLYSTRLDGGSWATATATRRLACGLRVCGLSDNVGGGGGGGGRLVLPL